MRRSIDRYIPLALKTYHRIPLGCCNRMLKLIMSSTAQQRPPPQELGWTIIDGSMVNRPAVQADLASVRVAARLGEADGGCYNSSAGAEDQNEEYLRWGGGQVRNQSYFFFLEGGEEGEKRKVIGWPANLLVLASQPPTVACKMEAPSEYVHVAYTFLHVWRRLVCSVGAC